MSTETLTDFNQSPIKTNDGTIVLLDNPKLIYFQSLTLSNRKGNGYGDLQYIGKLSSRRVLLKFIAKNHQKEMENELQILSDLSHTNITSIMFRLNYEDDCSFLVTNSSGYLLSEVKDLHIEAQTICRQLMNALEYLNKKQIAHLEISPQNITIDRGESPPKVQLFNFHRAQKYQQNSRKLTGKLKKNEACAAPEILIFETFSLSSDIYSLGCVYFYIITDGESLTPVRTVHQTNAILSKVVHSIPDDSTSTVLLKDLLYSMLQFQPGKRCTPSDALQHPFFWSKKDMISFILEITKMMETDIKNNLFQRLFKGSVRVIDSGWTTKIESELLYNIQSHMNENQRKTNGSDAAEDVNGNNIVSLIKSIRNTWCHGQSDLINSIVGTDEETFMDYWNERFPKLILHLYKTKLELDRGETTKGKENINSNNRGRGNSERKNGKNRRRRNNNRSRSRS